MAITATDRGTGNHNSAGTTITVVPASNMAAGSTGILVIAMDNANGASSNLSATSYTDSVGNVWYAWGTGGVSGAANLFSEGQVLYSRLSTGFTTSDSLTINLVATTTAKAWTLTEASCGAGNAAVVGRAAWASTASTGAPTITSLEASVGDLIIGMGAAESPDTWVGDGDTTNGTWSTKQSTGVGSGATGISVISQAKVVSAYATQTYNPTLTSADVRVGWIVMTEANANCRSAVSNATAESATNIFATDPMSVGSLCVLAIAANNAGTSGGAQNIPSSIVDSQSNTWTLRNGPMLYDPAGANAGVEIGIYTSVLTAGFGPLNSMTMTYLIANVAVKCWAFWEFAPQSAGTMSYVTGAAGTGSASNPTVTTSSITSGDYVVGVAGSESDNAWAGDADSTNGAWKAQATVGTGAGISGIALTTQWKLTTGTATQTYNPTCGSVDNMIGWIQITETPPGGGGATGSFFAFF